MLVMLGFPKFYNCFFALWLDSGVVEIYFASLFLFLFLLIFALFWWESANGCKPWLTFFHLFLFLPLMCNNKTFLHCSSLYLYCLHWLSFRSITMFFCLKSSYTLKLQNCRANTALIMKKKRRNLHSEL